jgi:hypothetical protein
MVKKHGYLKFVLVAVLCVSVLVLFSPLSEAGKYKKEYKMTLNVPASFYWAWGLPNLLNW